LEGVCGLFDYEVDVVGDEVGVVGECGSWWGSW